MSKEVLRCQQVIDDKTKRECGKPGKYYPGLGFVLCKEHARYVRSRLSKAFGLA